jgi:hypothetical protein
MNQVSMNEVETMLELYKKFGSSIIHGLHIHKVPPKNLYALVEDYDGCTVTIRTSSLAIYFR